VDDATEFDQMVSEVLEPGEAIRLRAHASDAVLALTDRRIVVAAPSRVALSIPVAGLRRVQFDIERSRPATLVLVPEDASYEAQVLTIAPSEYRAATETMVAMGHALAELTAGKD
jgi:hypothetical protein